VQLVPVRRPWVVVCTTRVAVRVSRFGVRASEVAVHGQGMTEHAAEIADRGPEVAVRAPGIIVRVARVIDHVLQEADMRRAVAVHAAGIIEHGLEVSEYRSAIGRTALAVAVYAPATGSDAIPTSDLYSDLVRPGIWGAGESTRVRRAQATADWPTRSTAADRTSDAIEEWWRRRESNPRPKARRRGTLHACPLRYCRARRVETAKYRRAVAPENLANPRRGATGSPACLMAFGPQPPGEVRANVTA
jgi:hypothetical protein